jgi:chromosome segregation ATPase
MGFLDKTISKTKSSFATTSSKLDEKREVNALQNQIKAERAKVKENYETIGKEYYRWTYDSDEEHKKNCDRIVEEINESRQIIEDLEQQISNVRAEGKEHRSTIKAETDAKIEEIEEADAQARDEKEKQRKEREDPF